MKRILVIATLVIVSLVVVVGIAAAAYSKTDATQAQVDMTQPGAPGAQPQPGGMNGNTGQGGFAQQGSGAQPGNAAQPGGANGNAGPGGQGGFAQPGSGGQPGSANGSQQGGAMQQPAQNGPQGAGGPVGLVKAIDSSSLTLEVQDMASGAGAKQVTVSFTTDTKVRLVESAAQGSLSDIQVGSRVKVEGRPNQQNGFDAQAILVLPSGDELAGKVVSVDGNIITLETRQGQVKITVSADTQYRKAPGEQGAGSLADISQGKFLVAYGELQSDGTLVARLVMLNLGPRPGGPGQGQQGQPGSPARQPSNP